MWIICKGWRRRKTSDAEKDAIVTNNALPPKLQIHLSTALALMFLAGLIMAFNFLPEIRTEDSTFGPLRQTVTRTAKEYGWPAPVVTHVQYSSKTFDALKPYTNEWQTSYTLAMGGMDLFFALFLLVIMWRLCEAWIRHNENPIGIAE